MLIIAHRWVIVVVAGAIMTIAYSMHFSYGVFLPRMVADLGWDRATLSAPFSIYVLIYSACSYFSGRVTDLHGTRMILIAASILTALAYVLLARVDMPWQVFAIFIVIAGPAMGAIYIPMNATVSKWFVSQRGLALSIVGSGVSLAAFVGPLIVTVCIAWWGWRDAMTVTGVAAGVLIFVLSFLIKTNPNGLPRRSDHLSHDANPVLPQDQSWSFPEAFRTRAFWLILIMFFCSWSVIFLPYVHLPGYAQDLNISAAWGAGLIGALGLGGLAGRLLIGLAADRIGILTAITVTLLVQAVGFAGLIFSPHLYLLLPVTVFLGLGTGSISVLFNALVPQIFGQAHVGAISGFLFAISGSAAAIGPYLAGYIRDVSGNFEAAFWFGAAINIFALVFVGFIRKPKR